MIHPTAIIEDSVKLGVNVRIGAYSCVTGNVVLGDNVVLESHVVVTGNTTIGDETHIFPFASIGHIPQYLKFNNEEVRLEIGARNQIREYVSMHLGTAGGGGVTRVGNDGLFMVGVHIAHDCIIGDNVILGPDVKVGGHVTVDDFTNVGGAVAIHQHCRVGTYAFVGGGSIVVQDVIPFGMVTGNRAVLEGLNITGLKRRGFGRKELTNIRHAHEDLFLSREGTLAERLDKIAENYHDSESVKLLVTFMRAEGGRGYCMPDKC